MNDGCCKNCKTYTDDLIDEEMCPKCHDIWLEGLLDNPNMEPILRLNKFAKDIGFGGEDNGR